MKINEFIKRVNQIAWAVQAKDYVHIYNSKCMCDEDEDDWFLELSLKSDEPVIEHDWDCLGLYPEELEEIFKLIEKLKATPVQERFPEKRYHLASLRCVEGPVAIKQYVSGIKISAKKTEIDYTCASDICNACVYSQHEIDMLRQWLSSETIEAMKEEVPGDED